MKRTKSNVLTAYAIYVLAVFLAVFCLYREYVILPDTFFSPPLTREHLVWYMEEWVQPPLLLSGFWAVFPGKEVQTILFLCAALCGIAAVLPRLKPPLRWGLLAVLLLLALAAVYSYLQKLPFEVLFNEVIQSRSSPEVNLIGYVSTVWAQSIALLSAANLLHCWQLCRLGDKARRGAVAGLIVTLCVSMAVLLYHRAYGQPYYLHMCLMSPSFLALHYLYQLRILNRTSAQNTVQ